MGVVRYLLRISVLALAGLAAFCGLILLFHAQVALNRYAELHARETETLPMARSTGNEAAKSQSSFIDSPALASSASGPVRASEPPASNAQTTPPEVSTKGQAIAVRVSNANVVADVASGARRVDVVLVHQTASGSVFREVVLENVRVLTIEPIIAEGGDNDRSDTYAVSLDVDAESAENLLLASQAGTLSLVLHGATGDRLGDRPLEPRQQGIPALARGEPAPARDDQTPAQRDPTPAQDDPRFTEVRVNRIGGATSTHRVPKEQ